MPHCLSWLCLILLFVSNKLINICALPTLEEEEILPSRVLLRRELDEMTQKFLIDRDSNTHPYHSYIFNSGIGNREELQVEMLKKNPHFAAGEGVLSWQSVQFAGSLYLLGRKLTSVCLVVSSTQILSNRSAQFTEHIIDLGANVSSTAMFIRSDHSTSHPDVIAVIAVDNPSADLLWFRVEGNKMELIKRRNHYTRTTAMAALSVGGRNQLVLVDTRSPANVDVFEIVFESSGSSLGLSLLQNFSLMCACLSVTVFTVGQQLFLAFPLPCNESLAIHWLVTVANSPLFEHHRTLTLPRVSQVSTFKLAQQVYLAVNGDKSYVLRVTESGDFIAELSLDYANEWLAIPVNSYRDDVALFSRSANRTELFVWAGTMKGFKSLPVPKCDSCLDGNWLGATSVPLHHQHSVLLPQAKSTSSLITVVTSLVEKANPVLIQLINSTKHYEGTWKKLQSQISEAEQILKYTVNVTGRNNITAKWKIRNLETPELHLNSLVVPKSEREMSGETEPDIMDLSSVESLVNDTMRRGKELIKAVDERDRQIWGLEGFRGKVIVKGRLVIENLTVGYLNGHSMDDLLSDTFRKSKPQKILSNTVIDESVQTENIIVKKINNNAVEESLKFNNKPVVMKGNVTFLSPVVVDGDVKSASGKINGMYLSALCEGKENCAVYPLQYQEQYNDLNNTVEEDSSVTEDYLWEKVLGGKNLTVIKVNGITWEYLIKNVVYKNRYQNVPGTIIVKGILSSEEPVITHKIEYKPHKNESQNMMLQMLPDRKIPSGGSMLLEEIFPIDPDRDVIFSNLEVLGTVSCAESEWGEAAADVVLSTANPIKIQAHKVFMSGISVANNLDVKGSVAGVTMKDFITSDTHQVFDGTTTLQGNIILGNVTLGGLWNGVNISSSSDSKLSSFLIRDLRHLSQTELVVDKLRVTETFNGAPVSELVYTNNDVISVRQLAAATADVTEDISVVGKICGYSLNEFDKTRLSIKQEQNITGEFFIDKVHLKSNLNVSLLNNREVSYLIDDLFGNLNNIEELNLHALHVDGDITTDFGMNGQNLSDIAANAVWLFSNNQIEGPLIFKDELTVNLLECQGFLNNKPCQTRLDDTDVVYKNNGTVHLSGKIKFKNILNVSEDLLLEEINGNKVDDIFTKTTEQEISGDMFINGEMVVAGKFAVEGLLNNRNISEFGTKCVLANSTVTCAGDVHFEDRVNVTHFISEGLINEIDFELFTESLFGVYNDIGYISGFKNFTGKTTVINELIVRKINNHSWDDFVLNTVNKNAIEDVDSPITFEEKVVAQQISVDYDIDADSINGLNLNEWQSNAIYIKSNFTVSKPLHLESASSLGNITVDKYGNLNLELESIKLDTDTVMNNLRFESVTVTEEANIDSTVNGHQLRTLQKNTFKVSGDQMVTADLVILEDFSVSGSVDTLGHVNHIDLRDVVTLNTDQTLHGSYKFECVEAMQNLSATGKVSGLNMSEWKEMAVVQDKQQEMTGVWRIKRHLDLKGSVTGPGRLGDVDLQELTDNITRNIINVHEEMKGNLSTVCEDTNRHLNKARNQISELLYVDITQEITMHNVVSLVKYFKSGHEDFLAVCEESCWTTMFKWDKESGMFSKLYNQALSFGVSQMVELQDNNQTYLLSESSEQLKDCLFTGKQLWLFLEDQLKHVSSVDFLSGKILQGHTDLFYTMNSTGVFEWSLDMLSGTLFKMSKKWETNSVVEDNPLIQMAGLPTVNFTEVVSMESVLNTIPELLSSCGGEVVSLSVCPTHQFIAVATAEKTQVPRYSDHVKVYSYKQSAQLLDKLPAQRPSHLQWLHVPYQTWLVFMQNNSTLQLFHFQEGFQLRLSAELEASDFISLSLPLASKVSRQPYLVAHSGSSVKILRAVLQGDPFLGEDVICNFDEALLRVPGNN